MIQTIDPQAATPTTPVKPKVHWGRAVALVAFIGLCCLGGLAIGRGTTNGGGSDPAACRKMITATGSVDDQYLAAIHAAKGGSEVTAALYAAYGQAAKGLVSDSTWARLHQACVAVGVDIG